MKTRTPSFSGIQFGKNKAILSEIMRKQSVLVIIGVMTSEIILIVGKIYYPVTYQIPLDCIVNTICVWLMFRSSDKYWNKCVKCCCFVVALEEIHLLLQLS